MLNYKILNFAKKTHGTGMVHITKPKFENSEIPLPTLKEQHLVVAKIESIFSEIDSAARGARDGAGRAGSVTGQLEDLKSSILARILTSCNRNNVKTVPLRSVARFINGKAFKPSEWSPDGLPIVRIQNLTKSASTYNYCNFPVDPRYVIRNGQLLFAWSASLGAFIWKGGKAVLNQHIFRVEGNWNIIDKMYLYYALNHKIPEYVQNTHGTGMTHITKPKFENSQIRLPSLTEQRRVATRIESIFSKIDAEKAKIAELQARAKTLDENVAQIKESILHLAFSGRLLPGKSGESECRGDI